MWEHKESLDRKNKRSEQNEARTTQTLIKSSSSNLAIAQVHAHPGLGCARHSESERVKGMWSLLVSRIHTICGEAVSNQRFGSIHIMHHCLLKNMKWACGSFQFNELRMTLVFRRTSALTLSKWRCGAPLGGLLTTPQFWISMSSVPCQGETTHQASAGVTLDWLSNSRPKTNNKTATCQ